MSNEYLTYENKKYEVVQLKEAVDFEIHANRRWTEKGIRTDEPNEVLQQAFVFNVKRNYVDDTFSMFWPMNKIQFFGTNAQWNEDKFTASTSNKVTVGKETGLLSNVIEGNAEVHEAKSFSLENIKFRESSSWTKTWDTVHSNLIVSAFPHFASFPRQIMIKDNQVLELSLIREIKFYPNAPLLQTTDGRYSDYMVSRIGYSNIFIIPSEVDSMKHQVTIAKVFKRDDLFSDGSAPIDKHNHLHTYDYSHLMKYSTSSTSQDMNISFIDQFALDKNAFSLESDSDPATIYNVGKFDLVDNTYYDYENKKSVVGFYSNSQQGEIVPFNFKGSLTRMFDLGFISFLKDFKLGIISEITQQVLDPYSGQIILDLKQIDSFDSISEQYALDGLQLEELRSLLLEVKFIPLNGLRRYADE